MTPIDCFNLSATLLMPIDAGTVQSKLLALLLSVLTLGLLRIVKVCWVWRLWAGTLAAALWAPLFVYAFYFFLLTFLT